MQIHNFDVDIVIPSSKQKIKIDKDHIKVNNSSIACKDVKAIKYGVSLIGSKKKPERKDYNIDILSNNGEEISIKFSTATFGDLLEEDHTYYYIMSGVWQYVKKYLVSHFIEILNEKQTFEIGENTVTHEGFLMSYKTWKPTYKSLNWVTTTTDIVVWSDIKYYLKKGILHVESFSDKRKKAVFSLHDDWNAVVLNTLLHYLWQERRKEKLAKGEKI